MRKKKRINNDEFMLRQAHLFKCFRFCVAISFVLVFAQLIFFICDNSEVKWYKAFYFSGPAFVSMIIGLLIRKNVDQKYIDAYVGGKPIE